ncbi:MAG: RNA polymerase factor sigma-54 [Planctomycetota bacterium]|jgi:RNA polymerase sigma-54 factor
MRLEATQQLRLEQRMKLAPRIIQAMEILQLPMMALQERIEAEMLSNPVLEMHDPGVDDEAPPAKVDEPSERGEQDLVVDDSNGNSEDFERLADFEAEFGVEFARSDAPAYRPPARAGDRDRKMDAMANAPAPGISLNEYLLDQWRFVEADGGIIEAGELIINFIDADGYLRTPLEELQEKTSDPVPLEVLQAALGLVQMLEPIGVGSRDLQECLLLQLTVEQQAGIDVTLEMELVRGFLRDIEMNRLPQIARRTDKSIDEIKGAIENLSMLNPRPGSLIGGRTVPVISPDVMLDITDDGGLIISVPEGNSPRLRISKAYRRMARDRQTDRSARKFIQKNIRSAQWLVSAIEQRRDTVRRVVEEVFKVQRKFLDAGVEALKPLPMADVAKRVGVHVATISRAVAGKYVQTPRGIFPLRMFFSGGTTTAEGRDVSWDAVKLKLKEIIDAEDKSAPMNDDELSAEMKSHGIDIARRTVAKYRKLMSIPPARKRKQY